MWIFQPIEALDAARTLVVAGGAAVLWSSLVGFIMLVPMQPWGQRWFPHLTMKHIGAAHLDWIVLGLMLGLAAGVIVAFGLSVPRAAVYALIMGAWLNPMPYVFRAFGVNGFVLAGPPHQVAAALVGLVSSLCVVFGWGTVLVAVIR